MSKTQFTDGPWMVGRPNKEMGIVLVGCDLDDAEGFSIAEVCSDAPGEPGMSHTMADAHLIAAAPTLYMALSEAYAVIGPPEKHPQDDSGWFELSALIREVLAKARGEGTITA